MELRKSSWKILILVCALAIYLWMLLVDHSHMLVDISQKITLQKTRISVSMKNILYQSLDQSKIEDVSLNDGTDSNLKKSASLQNSSDSLKGKVLKYQTFKQQNLIPSRQLPTALIIGVKKGGTRALLEFLRLHPAIRAAGSEVHFFDHHYVKGFRWYRRRMPPTLIGQITMEKTPSYFVTSEVPRRVKYMNPGMKLIVVVRDPVTRAISDYTQVKSKRRKMPRFEDMAFLNGSSIVDTSWVPLKIGVYVRHLERWLQYFPLSQFLFVSGERLIADPVMEITRVQDFLGLKRVICEKHFYFNATKGFPCLLKSEDRATPHCLGKNKGRSHPYIDPMAIQRLRDFYRPFNQRFYQLAGMDFAVCRREGIHESVAKDVITIFKGKTVTQLEALQLHIQTKIMGKLEDVDIGYWESLLSQLKELNIAYMAKIRLRDGHQENLYKKLEVLIVEQGVVTAENETESLQTQESESLIKQEEPSTNAAVEKNENNQDDNQETNATDIRIFLRV